PRSTAGAWRSFHATVGIIDTLRIKSPTGQNFGRCARAESRTFSARARAVGARQVLAPCAVGGLRPDLGPGTFVLPDQLIDRTSGRAQTFYDDAAVHLNFADPYCPVGRDTLLRTAAAAGVPLIDGGTMVVVEGPR